MRPFTATFSPVTTSAAGLASGVAYAGGGYALTANSAGDNLAHLITVTGIAVTNHSGKTFTITGTDAEGMPQSEGIAGPNGAVTVTTTKFFLTVTSVTVSATTGADTFNIGWNVAAVSYIYPIDWCSTSQAALYVSVTGTVNFTIYETFDNILGIVGEGSDYVTGATNWIAISTFSGKTANTVGTADLGATAVILYITSVTNGATVTVHSDQAVRSK